MGYLSGGRLRRTVDPPAFASGGSPRLNPLAGCSRGSPAATAGGLRELGPRATAGLNDYLPGGTRRSADPVFIEVGGLLGLVGTTEVQSVFSGTLEGVLVLAGEPVNGSQPIAWLRTPTQDERTS